MPSRRLAVQAGVIHDTLYKIDLVNSQSASSYATHAITKLKAISYFGTLCDWRTALRGRLTRTLHYALHSVRQSGLVSQNRIN